MFHVTRKCTHSSQYQDGLSAGENRSTGGTRVSNPSMSSDNPSFLPDDGKYLSYALIKRIYVKFMLLLIFQRFTK